MEISSNRFYRSFFSLIFIIRSRQALNRFENIGGSPSSRDSSFLSAKPKLSRWYQSYELPAPPRQGFGTLDTYFKVHSRKIDLPGRIPPRKILPRAVSSPRLVRTLVRFYVPVNARLLSAFRTHALLFTINNGSSATTNVPTIFNHCTNASERDIQARKISVTLSTKINKLS